jgi:hypothetical protein
MSFLLLPLLVIFLLCISYINRQAIKDGVRLMPEQKKEVESLNKQMRQIYREANAND